jgi:NAD(P)-dependent dehydrogenase (short-subunit alcohol dehydrogenase family)
VFCLDVQAEAVEEAAKHAASLGVDSEARVCDVSDEASVNAAVDACVARFGKLDALCHVAGILRFSHFHEMTFALWRQIQSSTRTARSSSAVRRSRTCSPRRATS